MLMKITFDPVDKREGIVSVEVLFPSSVSHRDCLFLLSFWKQNCLNQRQLRQNIL